MFTSTNGGKNWTAATVATAHGLGGQPLAQPNGTVVVPFSGDFANIGSLVSNDGGVTYSGPYPVSTTTDHGVPFVRTEPLPTAEVDKKGKVYVVWQDCRFETNCATNDMVMSTSKDGKTWSKVVRIPIDKVGSGVDHFIPGLGVGPSTGGRRRRAPGADLLLLPDASRARIDTCKMYAGLRLLHRLRGTPGRRRPRSSGRSSSRGSRTPAAGSSGTTSPRRSSGTRRSP